MLIEGLESLAIQKGVIKEILGPPERRQNSVTFYIGRLLMKVAYCNLFFSVVLA